jgi:hypothetical protein
MRAFFLMVDVAEHAGVPRTLRSAQRCAAEPGSTLLLSIWVPALRRSVGRIVIRHLGVQ